MATGTTICNDQSSNNERRRRPRGSLSGVLLVFFGEDNWGKVTDVTENGVSFEFAKAPSVRQRMDFRFEAMGDLGSERSETSFEASGEVVWTREFEKTAGARFLDLPEKSLKQIRNLLSMETFPREASRREWTRFEGPVPCTETSQPQTWPLGERQQERKVEVAPTGRETTEPNVEENTEARANPPSELIERILEAPTFQAYEKLWAEEQRRKGNLPESSSNSLGRGWIAAFKVKFDLK